MYKTIESQDCKLSIPILVMKQIFTLTFQQSSQNANMIENINLNSPQQ